MITATREYQRIPCAQRYPIAHSDLGQRSRSHIGTTTTKAPLRTKRSKNERGIPRPLAAVDGEELYVGDGDAIGARGGGDEGAQLAEEA